MRSLLALAVGWAICWSALADDTPELVLVDDGPPRAAPASQPPLRPTDTDDRPDLAFADAVDPNPGSGTGQIIAGWIASGVGLAGVAQSSTCELDLERFGSRERRRCRNVGIVLGAIGLGFGVPWLVFGYQKRRALREWKERHGLSALPRLELAGNTLLLRYTF